MLVNKYTALKEVFIPHIHKNGITTTPLCSTYKLLNCSIGVPDTESDWHCGTDVRLACEIYLPHRPVLRNEAS